MKLHPIAALQVDLCKPKRSVRGYLLPDRSIYWRFYRGKKQTARVRLSQRAIIAMMRIAHDLYENNDLSGRR